ncbi:hypothetical protein BGZ60DRAFT_227661 [Tricladium varicosporioides]|nr:hypothetical protein BGZ60DRAFT_227661 [Hymenoscyphus varicosporioides]
MTVFRSSRAFAATNIISALFFIHAAEALTYFDHPRTDPTGANPCHILGDIDVYGLGYRLSFYLQWLSMVLAPYLLPPESQLHFLAIFRTTTNALTIAVFANTLNTLSFTPPSPQPYSGPLIILETHIIYTLAFLLPLSLVPISPSALRASKYSLLTQATLGCMIVFAQPWLWFIGIDIGKRAGCDVKVFLLVGHVTIYNKGWSIAFKVGSILSVLAATHIVLKGLNWIRNWLTENKAKRAWSSNDIERAGDSAGRLEPRLDGEGSALRSFSNDQKEETPTIWVKLLLTGFQLISGGVAILQTEMTIRINDVDLYAPLRSSGQMIPFVIGVVTILVTFGKGLLLFVAWCEKERAYRSGNRF